jgi:hypothetical protein
VGKVAELEYKSEWKTESDWQQGYAAIVQWEAYLMACGQQLSTQLSELSVLLAKAHGLSYTADLALALPQTAAALQASEQADTGGAMDAIYEHIRTPNALGYRAGHDPDSETYDETDTQKAWIETKLGYATSGDDVETDLKALLTGPLNVDFTAVLAKLDRLITDGGFAGDGVDTLRARIEALRADVAALGDSASLNDIKLLIDEIEDFMRSTTSSGILKDIKDVL